MTTNNKSFVFKTKQTGQLRASIFGLCDPQFNPKSVAVIDVDDTGLQITVPNVDCSIHAKLKLQGTYNDDFVYNTPFNSRMFYLLRVLRYLALADNDDILTIYHILHSDQLSFAFGSNEPVEFYAKLLEPNVDFRQFPVIHECCGIVLPTRHLRQIISSMSQDEKPQKVSVKISQKNVNITVGNNEWRYEDEISETRGWNTGDEFSLRFHWPQRELLMYASHLSKMVSLCCVDDPPNSVMFRFSVSKTWVLEFISSTASNLEKREIYSFRFQLCPVDCLKQALLSLTDWSFNKPPGLGMILVNKSGFDIVVRNPDTGVTGFLHLVDTGLINFRCVNPLEGKLVNVDNIASNIWRAPDNGLVAFSQLQGSDKIIYKTGPAEIRTYAAELLEMDDQFKECPYEISIVCEATLPSKDLREMIPRMVKGGRPQIVSFQILHGFVSISVGGMVWNYDYNEKLLEQKHRVQFEWPYSASLERASFLIDHFGLSILSKPADSVMFRFKIRDTGYLIYITKEDKTSQEQQLNNNDNMTTNNESFIYKTKQTRELRASISALCDPEFNPKSLAVIDVDDRGLQITALNVEHSVHGKLKMQGTNADDFVYNTPFNSRMLFFDRVLRYLALADDNDTVTIYHVLESDELSFACGSNESVEFSAKLLDPDADFRQFPVIDACCGVVLPTQHLRQMISSISQEGKPQYVSVKMSQKNVNITVGNNEWRYEEDEISAARGWNPGEEFSLRFQWPQLELLMYASHLSKAVTLCFLDDPPNSVMFRFSVSKTWNLAFISSTASNLEKSVIYSFRFQLCPVDCLKQALLSLTDRSFCKPPGLGMIQVSKSGFDIVVRNPDSGVTGFLHLVDTGLINFRCTNSLEGKLVNVNNIASNISRAPDNGLVAFSQLQGSNEIIYKTGPAEIRTYAAELLEMNDQFRQCPYEITIVCEATLPSKHLREMIPLMIKEGRPQLVSFQILCGIVSICVGGRFWCYDCNKQLQEKRRHVWFEWPYPASLEQASYLIDQFGLSILSEPADSVMFRFKVRDAGYLVYVTKVLYKAPTSTNTATPRSFSDSE